MKVLSVSQVREADAYTIAHEPISDLELMERAAGQLFLWFRKNIEPGSRILIFCGPGNNGGDGLVLARLLLQDACSCRVYLFSAHNRLSPSCQANLDRLLSIPGNDVIRLDPGMELPGIPENSIVADALFGSGLNKPLEGYLASLVDHINKSGARVIAVDVPSGFFCDQPNEKGPAIIRAEHTLTFQFPKKGFFFAGNYLYTGKWTVLPIGLHPRFIEDVKVNDYFSDETEVKNLIKKRPVFSHKGSFGHGLLVSGSYGKMGASVLGARAALRSGAGLITVHCPACGYSIVQTSVPEAMLSIDPEEKVISQLPDTAQYNAIAIGPGMGTSERTGTFLKLLIQQSKCPLILDADAINLLSENKTWLSFLPAGSILTPHPGEFRRLAGEFSNDFERNQVQRELSVKFRIYIVLKGAYSAITTPSGECYFNSTGNPGMATGGSGDVLTGILLGLLAQGYDPEKACLLGVFIHGRAGDIALETQSYESLIAGDIVENLGKAFKTIEK